MNISTKAIIAVLLVMFLSCTSNVVELKNSMKGKLKSTYRLTLMQDKKYKLDSVTSPKSQYMQIYAPAKDSLMLTFLNKYTNNIYIYDYLHLGLKRRIVLKKDGADGIKAPLGYFIKNYDSVYVYNKINSELVLINDAGKVLSRISLINNQSFRDLTWTYHYPQYFPTTSAPMVSNGRQIIFSGQYMLSLPDSVAKSFKLEAHINFDNNKVDFWRKYPDSLYGHNYFWENEGTFTFVYYDLIPDNKVVYSFPVSHDIYLAGIESDSYSTRYAGSNEAAVISSFEKSMPYKELLLKMCKMDLYAAIKYDPYRKVYYRFLRKAIPDATYKT